MRVRGGIKRIIAVVPRTNSLATTTRDFGASFWITTRVRTLEALESRRALTVFITLAGTGLQGPNRAIVVPPRKRNLGVAIINLGITRRPRDGIIVEVLEVVAVR